jgi:hypothetical protein
MAQVTNQPARTARQEYVRKCILRVQEQERAALRKVTSDPKARFSYTKAATTIAAWLERSVSTVKIWASIDKRDIPDDELDKLKTFMRKHYGQTVSS